MSAWIDQIFDSKIAKRGGTVRRKKSSVATYSSLAELKAEVKKRKFHMIEHGDQYIIFCNKALVKIVC